MTVRVASLSSPYFQIVTMAGGGALLCKKGTREREIISPLIILLLYVPDNERYPDSNNSEHYTSANLIIMEVSLVSLMAM